MSRRNSTQVTTIGREPGNQVVVNDTQCSRKHCSVSLGHDAWEIRDLGSSNGTHVNDKRVAGTRTLHEGDVIRIGAMLLLFTFDITQQLPAGTPADESLTSNENDAPVEEKKAESEHELEILARKSNSAFREDTGSADVSRFPNLYSLVAAMVESADIVSLADTVTEGLAKTLNADISAVLLLSEPLARETHAGDLRLISFRSPPHTPYRRVSDRLSSVALEVGDGLLALDIAADVSSGTFATLEQMNASSVICVPVRHSGTVLGLIHLYSLDPENSLDAQSLEFALAVADHMGAILDRQREQSELSDNIRQVQDENDSLRQLLEIESDLIGESPVMQQLRDEIGRFATADSAVLIRGESGVGKELVARAIHFNSPRRVKQYVCLNCAALAETLLESELFGHEKGSFTGPTQRKIGKFEHAHDGTLFLDEVGEMSAAIQAKFLRVLEGHPFERVGGQKPIQVDVRVAAATNRNLEEAVETGEFRKDLFFRLNILELEVPPLRDRAGDSELLAERFLRMCAERQGRPEKEFSEDALQLIREYEWPGNSRELRNVAERAFAISRESLIAPGDLRFSRLKGGEEGLSSESSSVYRPLSLQAIERRHVEATMIFAKWVKREAAKILGIERSTLDRKLKTHGIARPGDDS